MSKTISRISYKQELILNLKDKEYRDAFVASHIKQGIPFQIRALRDKNELSQEELATLIGKQQEAVSRLENLNYEKYTLTTLKELASAFDVGLVVRFVPFSELVEWDINFGSESLAVPSFPEERYFKEIEVDISEGKDAATTQFVFQHFIAANQEIKSMGASEPSVALAA